MIEKDYIMRLLKEFLDGIIEVLLNIENERYEQAKVQIEEYYEKYFKCDRLFFNNSSLEKIRETIVSIDIQESAIKSEMLAELLYIDGQLCEFAENRQDLFMKALYFYEFAEKNGNTFSADRLNKIAAIKKDIS